jgi:hypothetical protein
MKTKMKLNGAKPLVQQLWNESLVQGHPPNTHNPPLEHCHRKPLGTHSTRFCTDLGQPAVLKVTEKRTIMRHVFATLALGLLLGLFCLTNFTFAQTFESRPGIFEPAGAGFNHQTYDYWVLETRTGPNSLGYGAAGDIPVAGHWIEPPYDGIGVFRPAGSVYNRGTQDQWHLESSGNPDVVFYYGAAGDVPVVGDWTGSGRTTVGVFRPAGSVYNRGTQDQWLLRNSNTPGNPDIVFYYGAAGDIPVVGDWTGSGRTTIGLYRPPGTLYNKTSNGEWLLRNSNTPGSPDIVFYYGAAGDIPVVGDWTGSGRTTIGVFRPAGTLYNKTSNGEWLLRNSNTLGNPDIAFYDGYSDYASVPVVGTWVDKI